MRKSSAATTIILLGFLYPLTVFSQDEGAEGWPKEITIPQGKVIIYQPQSEELVGNKLAGRAAVAIEEKGSDAPVFGAIWFTARLETDRADRTAILVDVTVTNTRFPDRDEEKAERLKTLLEAEMPAWNIVISMDRLLTSLDLREQQIRAASLISTEPPEIIFLAEPAVLISLDGEARLKKEGDDLMRVVNTPFTLLLDTKSKNYYLNADAKSWYTAKDISGDWSVTSVVPQHVAALAPEPEEIDPRRHRSPVDDYDEEDDEFRL